MSWPCEINNSSVCRASFINQFIGARNERVNPWSVTSFDEYEVGDDWPGAYTWRYAQTWIDNNCTNFLNPTAVLTGREYDWQYGITPSPYFTLESLRQSANMSVDGWTRYCSQYSDFPDGSCIHPHLGGEAVHGYVRSGDYICLPLFRELKSCFDLLLYTIGGVYTYTEDTLDSDSQNDRYFAYTESSQYLQQDADFYGVDDDKKLVLVGSSGVTNPGEFPTIEYESDTESDIEPLLAVHKWVFIYSEV